MRTFTLALAFVVAAACGGADPRPSSGLATDPGKADTLHPTGNEAAGTLTVVEPDGSALGLASPPVQYQVGFWASGVAPSKLRLAPGVHDVGMYITDQNGPYLGSFSADIKAGKELVVKLGGVHLAGPASSRIAGDVGETVSWYEALWGWGGGIDVALAPATFVPIAPRKATFGLYRALSLGVGAPIATVEANIGPGEIKTIALDYNPLGSVHFVAPVRALPSASTVARFAALAEATSQLTNDSSALVQFFGAFKPYGDAPTDTIVWDDAKFSALASAHATLHYYLFVNGTYAEITVEAGKQVDVAIKRLDVEDVAVTREDGSVVQTPGTWSLEWQTPSGAWIPVYFAQNLPTNQGLDLVAGSYRATVTYATFDNNYQSDVYDVELH